MERLRKLVKSEGFFIFLGILILGIVYLLFGRRGVQLVMWTLCGFVLLSMLFILFILSPLSDFRYSELIRRLFQRRVSVTSEEFRRFLEEQIAALRPLGFFEEHSDTDDETLRNILMERIQEGGRGENVGQFLIYPAKVGALDEKRVLYGDTERDLLPGNDEYICFLNELAGISRGRFQPENIREIWSEDEQEVTIEFELDGRTERLQPEVDADWLDPDIFSHINDMIKESGYSFEFPRSDHGQDYTVVFVSAEEWKRLKELKW